ncbi:MAG: SHOCT domain-containing protein [Planctomycetaceae bacterium]|nr:SHOCT domain-containing protein [Planctomycetaceae bacterium]
MFAALERLGELRHKGIVTDDEFNQKKGDLLSRL